MLQTVFEAYIWLLTSVPSYIFAMLQGLSALYVGYLIGKLALAHQLGREGYSIKVYKEEDGTTRYIVIDNSLENIGE